MPLYVIGCDARHRSEVLQPHHRALPRCAECGGATERLPAPFAAPGAAATLPPATERMPQTWRGTHGGDRAYLSELRRTAERRRDLEERHPDLRSDRRPIVAHEGRFDGAPLRAGDPIPHAHGHPHGHPHPGAHTDGPAASGADSDP